MSSLDELFPAGDSGRAAAQQESRLGAIVGDAVALSAPIDHEAERLRLQNLVGPAGTITLAGDARAVAALPAAAETRTKARSRFLRRQRRDWLTVAAAVLAVAAVALAGLMGVRTAMASTPTDDSRALLIDSEEALASTISAANAERARLEVALEEARTQSQVAATSLASMTGVVDESSRVALVAAVDTYLAGIRAITVPPKVEPFPSAPITAASSLTEIGSALEAVDARQLEVDAAQSEFRELNASVVSQRDMLAATVKPLADSMIVLAGAEIAQRAAALPAFRTAVQNAANGLAAARATGRMGWVEMQVLSDVIRALRVDDERGLLHAGEEESSGGSSGGSNGDGGTNNGSEGGGGNPGDTPAPPDPGTGGGTTDSGTTDGGATDGGVTDGGATDGGTTDPPVVFPMP